MTAALIYLACAILASVGLFAYDHLVTQGASLWSVVICSIVWPLTLLAALGFCAGVALGWLEGLVP